MLSIAIFVVAQKTACRNKIHHGESFRQKLAIIAKRPLVLPNK